MEGRRKKQSTPGRIKSRKQSVGNIMVKAIETSLQALSLGSSALATMTTPPTASAAAITTSARTSRRGRRKQKTPRRISPRTQMPDSSLEDMDTTPDTSPQVSSPSGQMSPVTPQQSSAVVARRSATDTQPGRISMEYTNLYMQMLEEERPPSAEEILESVTHSPEEKAALRTVCLEGVLECGGEPAPSDSDTPGIISTEYTNLCMQMLEEERPPSAEEILESVTHSPEEKAALRAVCLEGVLECGAEPAPSDSDTD